MIRSAFSGVNYACMKLGDAAAASLTAAQRADADSLKLAKRRAEREAVYSLINGCIAPGRLLSHAPDGAPAIDGVGSFSLSHSPRHAAIAWVDAPEAGVGIDVEEDSERLPRLTAKFISDDEFERLAPLTDLPYLAAWTIKEAVFKASGSQGAVLRDIFIGSALRLDDDSILSEAVVGGIKSVAMTRRIAPETMLTVAKSSKNW